jgi:hypothetical protein
LNGVPEAALPLPAVDPVLPAVDPVDAVDPVEALDALPAAEVLLVELCEDELHAANKPTAVQSGSPRVRIFFDQLTFGIKRPLLASG